MRANLSKENYDTVRRELVERNSNLVGIILNQDEQKCDAVLTELKQAFKDDCNGDVPFTMPVLTDERIWNSRLYKFCKALPKGSDLHVHGTALLPCHKLIPFVLEHEKLLINVDDLHLYLEKKSDRYMPLKEAFYSGEVSRKELEKVWTVRGKEKGQNVWEYFESLFGYTGAIDCDMDILYDYYVMAFRDYVACHISHVEIHVLLDESLEISLETLKTIRAAYYEVKKDHPEFVVSVIGSGMKMFDISMEETTSVFNNTLLCQQQIKDESDPEHPYDFVLGFDLVNEEDTSRPLREFAPMLIDFKAAHPSFKYYLHSGESLNAESDNLMDAYLINVSRVGHGMNLYRYPNLLKAYADEEICLESCLISNQTLGYTKDIRLHPSAEYLKRGVTIALCSDDPVYQEHEQLTDDFFAAIISWNLGLADIKQLALNSITYSGLEAEPKRKLMKDWHEAWKEFVSQWGQE